MGFNVANFMRIKEEKEAVEREAQAEVERQEKAKEEEVRESWSHLPAFGPEKGAFQYRDWRHNQQQPRQKKAGARAACNQQIITGLNWERIGFLKPAAGAVEIDHPALASTLSRKAASSSSASPSDVALTQSEWHDLDIDAQLLSTSHFVNSGGCYYRPALSAPKGWRHGKLLVRYAYLVEVSARWLLQPLSPNNALPPPHLRLALTSTGRTERSDTCQDRLLRHRPRSARQLPPRPPPHAALPLVLDESERRGVESPVGRGAGGGQGDGAGAARCAVDVATHP